MTYENKRKNKIELVLQYSTLLGALIAAIWTAVTYLDGRNLEIEARKIEASKVFLELQLSLFKEVTILTSRLATTPLQERSTEDISRFWQLYWGELALVEKGEVEKAMILFGKLLSNPNTEIEELKQASLDTAKACRTELSKSWKVEAWLPDRKPSWWEFERTKSENN